MELRSSAFSEGDTVPVRFTCEGANVSPPLGWSDVPDGSTQLRLRVTDPDAPSGTFTHWLVTGIDPSGRYLLAVGQLSHGLSSYSIDQSSGKLTKLKEYPMGKNPNWVEIIDLP